MKETRELFLDNKQQNPGCFNHGIHLSLYLYIHLSIYSSIWHCEMHIMCIIPIVEKVGGWAALTHHPNVCLGVHTNSRKIRANFQHPALPSCVYMNLNRVERALASFTQIPMSAPSAIEWDKQKARQRARENERKRVHEHKIHFKLPEIDKPANLESIHEVQLERMKKNAFTRA